MRYTANSTLGDPGTMRDLLTLEHLPSSIAGDDDAYLRFRQTPRCLFNGQGWPAFVSNAWFQRSTAAGMALDPYMAPLMPFGRGEDSMAGKLFRHLYPQDCGLRFNFGMEHRPAVSRTWMIGPEVLHRTPSAPDAFNMWLSQIGRPGDIDPAENMQLTGEELRRMMDHGKREAFLQDVVNASYHRMLVDQYGRFSRALSRNPEGCAAWKADADAIRRETLEQLKTPERIPADDAAGLLAAIRRYAEALPVWNLAFAWCRDNGPARQCG